MVEASVARRPSPRASSPTPPPDGRKKGAVKTKAAKARGSRPRRGARAAYRMPGARTEFMLRPWSEFFSAFVSAQPDWR